MKLMHISDMHTGLTHKTESIHKKFFHKEEENINTTDGILITGDISNHKQKQLNTIFRNLREITDKPIYVVDGNHDFWGRTSGYKKIKESYHKIIENRLKICNEYKIHHLSQMGPVELSSDIKLWGFDGYYNEEYEDHNDSEWMSRIWEVNGERKRPFDFLHDKVYEDFRLVKEDVDSSEHQVKILATHFPPFDKRWNRKKYHGLDKSLYEPIEERFNYVFMGHYHKGIHFQSLKNRCHFLVSPCGPEKPIATYIQIEEPHKWFHYKNDKFRSCKKCGYIENKKNSKANCNGNVVLSLR